MCFLFGTWNIAKLIKQISTDLNEKQRKNFVYTVLSVQLGPKGEKGERGKRRKIKRIKGKFTQISTPVLTYTWLGTGM